VSRPSGAGGAGVPYFYRAIEIISNFPIDKKIANKLRINNGNYLKKARLQQIPYSMPQNAILPDSTPMSSNPKPLPAA
jgi:hypothetical protein